MVRWTVIEKAKVCRMLQRDADATRHRISRGALLCIFGEIGLARSDTDEILVTADSSSLFSLSFLSCSEQNSVSAVVMSLILDPDSKPSPSHAVTPATACASATSVTKLCLTGPALRQRRC